jgi:hypothetical protein
LLSLALVFIAICLLRNFRWQGAVLNGGGDELDH